MGFRVDPIEHGVAVLPPRARALAWCLLAAWNGFGTWMLLQRGAPAFLPYLTLAAAAAFLLLAWHSTLPTRITVVRGTFRCVGPRFGGADVELPLAEVDHVALGSDAGRPPSLTVSVVTTSGRTQRLPLSLDSIVLAANNTDFVLLDGRAKAPQVQALVETVRAMLDDARRQSLGYRRLGAGPEPLAEPAEREAAVVMRR